jgi:5-methylthioribose kinase
MFTSPAQFRAAHPGLFFLDAEDLPSLESYLRSRGALAEGDAVLAAARAGEGNMNCTARVTTRGGSVIVKQARPWVERYPQFAAPWDRACREAEFYQLIAGWSRVADRMPRLRHFDAKARVLVLEDLGVASDYTGVYRGQTFQAEEIQSLAEFLSALHESSAGVAEAPALPNREMRALNHAHLFQIPLARNNGLDLDAITPGLADTAQSLQSDAAFCREVARMGREAYLADGPCLLHGDFFPGSLLRTVAGPRVIDPEFGFFGRPEFDVAVFLAHLLLAHQPAERSTQWRGDYAAPAGFDDELMLQLAGVEIMRRLIGYAQLPLGYGLPRKRELLELARNLVLEPRRHRLAAT